MRAQNMLMSVLQFSIFVTDLFAFFQTYFEPSVQLRRVDVG